jgi:multimeric flavodoxin WrbA
LKFSEFASTRNKKKVVLVVGSARSPDCCPDEKSKTHKIAEHIVKSFEGKISFDTIDLSVKCDGINVQPCKGCVSTSSFHCHWPCDCYSKDSDPKDLMHQENVYEKLEKCDGFFVLTPINWSSCTSVVKSFFDRIVCASLTVTTKEAVQILGKDSIKDRTKTRKIEKEGLHCNLLNNHLKGKYAGFFAHGNGGGSDYLEFAKKKNSNLPVIPESLVDYEKKHGKENINKLLDPIVRQCVYSGIFVPYDCVRVVTYGFGISYSEVNDMFKKDEELNKSAEEVFDNFISKL